MNIEEKRVNFDTITLAKEKGFNLDREFYNTDNCKIPYFLSDGTLVEPSMFGASISKLKPDEYEAVTLNFLKNWLREIKNIDVSIQKKFQENSNIPQYKIVVTNFNKTSKNIISDAYIYIPDTKHLKSHSYNCGLEIGIVEGLKMIETNDI